MFKCFYVCMINKYWLLLDNEPRAQFLRKTAIPSVFCFTAVKPDNPEAKARQIRLEKRCQRKLVFQTNQDELQLSSSSKLTDMDVDHEEEVCYQEEIANLENTSVPKSTQVNHEHIFGTIERFKCDDEAIKFYTGFECYKKLYFVFSTLSPMANKIRYFTNNVVSISKENQFFLTMMKLRQNKCNFELSKFFNISQTTVSNIFITWVNFIYQVWSTLNIWPDKKLVKYYMPQDFKAFDPNLRVILDGTEIKVQKPKNPKAQQASWSSYKHANTLKVLVGATPGGLLSYCSQAYAGSISDRQAVERSNLFDLCESGDTILADRGFTVQDMFADKNVTVKIPSFLKGKSQLPGLSVLKDRELANKRVHIERIIGLTKTYKIISSELDHSYVPIASKIFFICFMCCNFRECIMKIKQ